MCLGCGKVGKTRNSRMMFQDTTLLEKLMERMRDLLKSIVKYIKQLTKHTIVFLFVHVSIFFVLSY